VGAGEAPSGFPTEREEEAGGGLGKEELTGRPGLSAGERERGREEAGWARPKKGRGGGLLSLQAEKRKGKGGKGFLPFFIHIFPNEFLFFKYFLAQNILVFKTVIT